jgi:hypothetical protein
MLGRATLITTATAVLAAGLYGVNLPRPAAEVAIAMPNGSQELLSKYRGKIVILTFILST